MVTIDEFMQMLNQLYDNGYVLINFKDIISIDKQGKVTFKPVKLPEGKKPLIISQDDVNYYEYMKNSGFADKLVVNKQGDVKNQYTNNGQTWYRLLIPSSKSIQISHTVAQRV